MKFVVSSTELLSHLQSISKVISNRNTLPILDNFLFKMKDNNLEITASDLETTLITNLKIADATENGSIAVPAKLLSDILKEFAEQPLTFDIEMNSLKVIINSENGKFTIIGQDGDDFPQIPSVKKETKTSINIPGDSLNKAIAKTLFATSDDELRPIMNGILFEIGTEKMTFVATDAQKLVRYQRLDVKSENEASFVLPKKPANLLKGILPKEQGTVVIDFDDKNAVFTLTGYKMICRLAEGQFPSYNAVIPADSANKMVIARNDLNSTIRRVSTCSNQASNLIKMQIKGNELTVSAQDIDFSISAYERLKCVFEGDDIEIGFKSTFLNEILSNLSSEEVMVGLSDPSRAGIIKPINKEDNKEDILMLLMPMMINA